MGKPEKLSPTYTPDSVTRSRRLFQGKFHPSWHVANFSVKIQKFILIEYFQATSRPSPLTNSVEIIDLLLSLSERGPEISIKCGSAVTCRDILEY